MRFDLGETKGGNGPNDAVCAESAPRSSNFPRKAEQEAAQRHCGCDVHPHHLVWGTKFGEHDAPPRTLAEPLKMFCAVVGTARSSPNAANLFVILGSHQAKKDRAQFKRMARKTFWICAGDFMLCHPKTHQRYRDSFCQLLPSSPLNSNLVLLSS